MATNYPVGIDTTGTTLPNPGAGNVLGAVGNLAHHIQHTNQNDSLRALENLVGTNASQTTPTAANRVLQSISATASQWVANGTISSWTLNGNNNSLNLVPTTTTSAAYLQITNAGGNSYVGMENSANGIFGNGAYALNFQAAPGAVMSWNLGPSSISSKMTLDTSGNLIAQGNGYFHGNLFTGSSASNLVNAAGQIGAHTATDANFIVYNDGAAAIQVVNDAGNTFEQLHINTNRLTVAQGGGAATATTVFGSSVATSSQVIAQANGQTEYDWNLAGTTKWQMYMPSNGLSVRVFDSAASQDAFIINNGATSVIQSNRDFQVGARPLDGNVNLLLQRNSTSNFCQIGFVTGATTEWNIGLNQAGTTNNLFWFDSAGSTLMELFQAGGLVLGGPTGSNKGAGTLNVAGGIYLNGTAYTNPDYVFEHWATGSIVKYAKNQGAADYRGLRPLSEVEQYVRQNHHLPGFATRELQDRKDTGRRFSNGKPVYEIKKRQSHGHDIFSGGEQVLLHLEEAYLYIFDLEHRIAALEAQAKAA